uniref:APC regulator of WNT signaling pathway n=1 Tax=Myotis myotis TaxID=51298 RepID=A0A7J7XXH6_MYOMY|nr:APC regulator of WNT signaling pathway [Myotis myotis]
MSASRGSGPEAALPASGPLSTLGFWGSGGGQGCVPPERTRPGGVRASGRGAPGWQVQG